MNKLEKNIIDRIYKMETNTTSLSMVMFLGLFLCTFFIVILFSQIFIDLFEELQTKNIFVIFTEGREVFLDQLNGFLAVVLQEIPYEITAVIVLSVVVIVVLMLIVIYNFRKMKNKISALIAYWGKKS